MNIPSSNSYKDPSFAASIYLQWCDAAFIANHTGVQFSRWNQFFPLLTTEGKIWINCYPSPDIPVQNIYGYHSE